jgi:uncharacterized YkwD family protein
MKKLVFSLVLAGVLLVGSPISSSAQVLDYTYSTNLMYKDGYVVKVTNSDLYNWNSWIQQFLTNYYNNQATHNQQQKQTENQNKEKQEQNEQYQTTEHVKVPTSEKKDSQPVQQPVEQQPTKQQPVQQKPAQQKPETEVKQPGSTYTINQFENEVVTLTNNERAKYGLKPLEVDIKLSEVARMKSTDMKQNGYFSHTSPTYGSPFDMMRKFGVQYRAAGENIAMGQRSPQEVVNAWMNSEGHRKNILNPNFTHIGVGHVSGNYWTQMFIGI